MLSSKASDLDIEDLKNADGQINNQLTALKEGFQELMEDRKLIHDITFLRKKVEGLNNQFLNFKNGMDANQGDNKGSAIDASKFVENTVFAEYQKSIIKEFLSVDSTLEERKRAIDDLNEELKSRPTVKDVKSLEEYILVKLDELKINSTRRFADKIDTNKNVKYLDTQVS